ncbi:putative TIM-barrel fold metal-dependent hydrolase [Actinokineospora spheciospongiae]|nr:putative TIM-barrel fold metal-dependent hydrolase [Actinokineospora spheciospongiae]
MWRPGSGYHLRVYADDLLRPWAQALLDAVPDLFVFDIHTHVGDADPSGFTATVDDVVGALGVVGARAAVFPLSEPSGYRAANEAVRAAAAAHPELVPFCRLRPDDDPVAEAERSTGAGARGIKLHPASDSFSLFDDRLDGVFDLAERERLPVVVHSGPESEPFGEALVDLLTARPELRVVLAHAGLTDLAWLAGRVVEFPNLLFDTSWWSPSDLLTLFARVPPGRILLGSDIPYATPLWAVHTTIRCALYSGLDRDQIACVVGGQAARLVAGEDLLDVGPAPGGPAPLDPLLERLYVYLAAAVEAVKRGESPGDTLPLARHSCRVPATHPHHDLTDSVLALLDRFEKHNAHAETDNTYAAGWDLMAAATVVTRTPGPPLPAL